MSLPLRVLVPLARALDEMHNPPQVAIPGDQDPIVTIIQEVVAEEFHIRIALLLSKKRENAHVAFVRQMGMYLSRELTELSFPAIGQHFNRDHSTVIHAHDLIGARAADNPPFRLTLHKLIERCYARMAENAA